MKKVVRLFSYLLIGFLLFLLIGELCYRYQVFNFYGQEFRQLNPDPEKEAEKTILIFGDSFSAYPNGYVQQLSEKSPEIRYINAAIPGTGIKQHRLMFENMIEEYQPDQIIYQFYVGNDFLDIQQPINKQTLSWSRNLYWNIAERLLFVGYLNYKLGAFNAPPKNSLEELEQQDFDLAKYNKRVKLQFKGNPNHLQETLTLTGRAAKKYGIWKKHFSYLVSILPKDTELSLMFIPHCAQVSTLYARRMAQMGANLDQYALRLNPALYAQINSDFDTVEIINPQEYFQNAEQNGYAMYFENDPHLSPTGQAIFSRYLYIKGY